MKTSRSGSRAPKNPKTKAQRLIRVEELTQRMAARAAEIQHLGEERNAVLADLREVDGLTYREIASAAGISEQALHKAFTKTKA